MASKLNFGATLIKPDMKERASCRKVILYISLGHKAKPTVFVAFRQILQFREGEKIFRFGLKHIIVLYLEIVNTNLSIACLRLNFIISKSVYYSQFS